MDFVRLLAALDQAIPRYIATKQGAKPAQIPYGKPFSTSHLNAKPPADPGPAPQNQYMVERPFDLTSTASDADADYASDASDLDPDRELVEPDEFSWPNIKRFMVILLSSLCWNNRAVQDVVREHGGVHAVLNQCKIDDDNPYIREHAILCVRALLHGNIENQKVVEELEKGGGEVPEEVLEKSGFEPFIDERGRVRLRKGVEK